MLRDGIAELKLADTIEMLPLQKDVTAQYRAASLYAMSSHHEGLPLVLIEAMAMGLPIVSYDCPTGPSDIVTDGKTVILVPYLNVQALAESLDKVMLDDDLRRSMSLEALKEVEKFSAETIVDIWEKTIKEL